MLASGRTPYVDRYGTQAGPVCHQLCLGRREVSGRRRIPGQHGPHHLGVRAERRGDDVRPGGVQPAGELAGGEERSVMPGSPRPAEAASR
jgi:hypothetical protein